MQTLVIKIPSTKTTTKTSKIHRITAKHSMNKKRPSRQYNKGFDGIGKYLKTQVDSNIRLTIGFFSQLILKVFRAPMFSRHQNKYRYLLPPQGAFLCFLFLLTIHGATI